MNLEDEVRELRDLLHANNIKVPRHKPTEHPIPKDAFGWEGNRPKICPNPPNAKRFLKCLILLRSNDYCRKQSSYLTTFERLLRSAICESRPHRKKWSHNRGSIFVGI